MSRHSVRPVALALLVAAALAARGAVSHAALPEPSLQSYSTADGTTYFALSLLPNVPVNDGGKHDVLVLIDTSASQTGVIRQQSFSALAALLAGLGSEDRVRLVAVDLDAVPLSSGWAPASSPQTTQALVALKARVPLGATDMHAALTAALTAFDAGSPASRNVIYIGDGLSSANFLALSDYRRLVDELVAKQVSVSSYAIGPRVDSQLLASLANLTGGMLAIEGESIDPKQAGSFLAESVRAAVLWPTSVTLPKELEGIYPERMPPLRSDRDTIVLGKVTGNLPKELAVSMQAASGGKTRALRWTLAPGPVNPDYAFLPVLVEGSAHDGGARLITLGSAGLREARRIIDEGTELLGKLSRQALVSGNLDTAQRLADEALRRDPKDELATSVKEQLKKLSGPQGSVASQPIETKEFSNQQAAPPVPDPPVARPPVTQPPVPQPPVAQPPVPQPPTTFAPEPGPADAYDPINDGEGRLLENIEQHNRLMTDLIRTETENALREARALMSSNPGAVEDSLKLMLGRVLAAPELRAETRAQLRGQLEAALRETARRATENDIIRQQEEVARAAALDRLQIANDLMRREEKLVQLFDRFNSLMAEGRYLAADELGETEIARLAPELPISQQAALVAHMTGAREADLALRMARQKAVVDTLGTVEVALMPFPDDQPVVYPPADVWQELTIRRKKYTATDLATVSPIEKKIRDALESPTRMEFIEMPLQDAVTYLKDFHDIEIQLKNRALEDAGVGSDTPVTLTVNGISLKSGLRLLLDDFDLTYIIKDEVLQITTQDDAETELVPKAYPVADLVIPVQSMSNMGGGMMGGGMMGGMGGGMMGGMGGGMGGGMMGGMGGGMMGGMGGMGGGMFAVPDDLKLGPKTKATPKPAAKPAPQPAKPQSAKQPAKAPAQAAKPAAKPTAIQLAIPAGTDPETAWADYLGKHPDLAAGSLQETARELMHGRKFADLIGMIRAALRTGHPEPWMYEAMALAMQAGGSSPKDIERALMSAVDFGQGSDELMYVAQYMARSGLQERALKVFHQVAQVEPLRPEPYLYGLQLAERLHNLEGIRWSSLGILKQAWPKEKAKVVDQARRAAAAAVEELKTAGRLEDAERLQEEIDAAKVRDCIVKVSWTGDADVDVMVQEPSGAMCAFNSPRTTGGGVLIGDTSSQDNRKIGEGTSESYECPEAFAGTYRVLIRRVWGKVTAGKVTVDLYVHYGTPEEKHMRHQISLGDKDSLVQFDLPKGRREEPLAEHQLANAAAGQLAVNQAILAQQLNQAAASSGGAVSALAASRGDFFGVPFINQAVGYQPVIQPLPAGASLSVTGVVSADRRYVRITPQPFFSQIGNVTTFNIATGDTQTSAPPSGGGGGGFNTGS